MQHHNKKRSRTNLKPVEFKYNIPAIFKARYRLIDAASFLVGQVLVGSQFNTLVNIFWEDLSQAGTGLKEIDPKTIAQSLFYLFEQKLTEEQLTQAAHLIAGNVPLLKRGQTVRPWQTQTRLEWVPAQIVSVRLTRQYDSFGAILFFKYLAGTPCTEVTSQFWSWKKLKFFANKFGFNRYSKHPYKYDILTTPEQLVLFRLEALVEPELSKEKPNFKKFRFPSAAVAFNRKLIKYRSRVDFTCPFNFNLEHSCTDCSIGYQKTNTQSCTVACHPVTYTKKFCPLCRKESDWHDFVSRQMCVPCYKKKFLILSTGVK
jgi:hypothetical protein